MLDRQKVREIREKMQEALDDIGHELDVKFQVGNATFTSNTIAFKVEAGTIQDDGTVIDRTAESLKLYGHRYGLSPAELEREFAFNGRKFSLLGIKPRSAKYPILARCLEDGKTYKLPAWAASLIRGE